jgi:hypothetical protein
MRRRRRIVPNRSASVDGSRSLREKESEEEWERELEERVRSRWLL